MKGLRRLGWFHQWANFFLSVLDPARPMKNLKVSSRLFLIVAAAALIMAVLAAINVFAISRLSSLQNVGNEKNRGAGQVKEYSNLGAPGLSHCCGHVH